MYQVNPPPGRHSHSHSPWHPSPLFSRPKPCASLQLAHGELKTLFETEKPHAFKCCAAPLAPAGPHPNLPPRDCVARLFWLCISPRARFQHRRAASCHGRLCGCVHARRPSLPSLLPSRNTLRSTQPSRFPAQLNPHASLHNSTLTLPCRQPEYLGP